MKTYFCSVFPPGIMYKKQWAGQPKTPKSPDCQEPSTAPYQLLLLSSILDGSHFPPVRVIVLMEWPSPLFLGCQIPWLTRFSQVMAAFWTIHNKNWAEDKVVKYQHSKTFSPNLFSNSSCISSWWSGTNNPARFMTSFFISLLDTARLKWPGSCSLMFSRTLTPSGGSLFLRARTCRPPKSEVAETECTDFPSGLLRVVINKIRISTPYFPDPRILFRWNSMK